MEVRATVFSTTAMNRTSEVDGDFRHEYLLSEITSQHCCGGSETFICRLPFEGLGFAIIDVMRHTTILELIYKISLKRFVTPRMLVGW
jgi:hypothetical protein